MEDICLPKLPELPADTKKIIASFLADRSRRMIRSTNTQWFNIINYDFFTIYFARPTTLPYLVEVFSRYSKPIGLRFEKSISIDGRFVLLSSLTNLTSLEIEPNFSIEGRSNSLSAQHTAHFTALTNLQRLDLCQAEVAPYTQYFPKLTTLQIRIIHLQDSGKPFNYCGYSTDDLKILSKLGNQTGLRSLIIDDRIGWLPINAEDFTKMSRLSHLSFFSLRAVKCPFNKLLNLESLSITGNDFDDFAVQTKLTRLSLYVIGRTPLASVAEQLASLHSLKYLNLTGELTDEQLSFVCKLTKLEDFIIHSYSLTCNCSFLQLINSQNLTSLRVTATIRSLAYIAHLTNLQQLECSFHQSQLSIVPLFNLPNVTKLICRDSMQSTVNIEICPNVKEIVIGNCSGESVNRVIASLKHLEHFKAKNVDNSLLNVLSQHTQLTELEAWGSFNLSALQNLTGLKKLSLQCSFVEGGNELDELSCALRAMTNLEEILLNRCSEDIIDTLERLPNLKVLVVKSLDIRNITDTRLSNLTNLQSLEWTDPTVPSRRRTKDFLPYLYKYV